jgi:hypothetical protein
MPPQSPLVIGAVGVISPVRSSLRHLLEPAALGVHVGPHRIHNSPPR